MEISSTSTLDNTTASRCFRDWAGERADLVWAVRLPNTAFKGNAGTEVTTDIIVLRKKDGAAFPYAAAVAVGLADADARRQGRDPRQRDITTRTPRTCWGWSPSKARCVAQDEPARLPTGPDQDLAADIRKAAGDLPAGIVNTSSAELIAQIEAARPTQAKDQHKENSYQLDADGNVRQVPARMLVQPDWAKHKNAKTMLARAGAFIEVRDAARDLIDLQRDPDAADDVVEHARAFLNSRYDAFVKKWGPLTGRGNSHLNDDPEWAIAAALEYGIEEKQTSTGKDGQPKTTFVKGSARPTSSRSGPSTPGSPRSGPTRSGTLRWPSARAGAARSTCPTWCRPLNLTPDQAADEAIARDLAYLDPDTGRLQTPDEYLAGNVRLKLARGGRRPNSTRSTSGTPRRSKQVQPAPLRMSQISVRLGSTWVPPNVIESWLEALTGAVNPGTVHYTPQVGTWSIDWNYQAATAPPCGTSTPPAACRRRT